MPPLYLRKGSFFVRKMGSTTRKAVARKPLNPNDCAGHSKRIPYGAKYPLISRISCVALVYLLASASTLWWTPFFGQKKTPSLDRAAALKMKESQCLKQAFNCHGSDPGVSRSPAPSERISPGGLTALGSGNDRVDAGLQTSLRSPRCRGRSCAFRGHSG